jgi:hypothetical protein
VIRYALGCEKGHQFESWFADSAAFDKQAKRGLVTCPMCGSPKVEKAIMAPALKRKDKSRGAGEPIEAREATEAAQPAGASDALREPGGAEVAERSPVAIVSERERELRQKLKELREHLIKDADNVGRKFPEEARRMHYGEIEHRSIYGEASPDEAKALREEGIEFHPLPHLPEERN